MINSSHIYLWPIKFKKKTLLFSDARDETLRNVIMTTEVYVRNFMMNVTILWSATVKLKTSKESYLSEEAPKLLE